MTTTRLLLAAWNFEWSINIGCVVVLSIYLRKVKASMWRRSWFVLGILILFLALQSPLDPLGDDYLFSAHMLQHLLLILVVSPLFVLGISEQAARKWLRVAFIAKTEYWLGKPAVAWWSATLDMTIWHFPLFYNFALAHEQVHILQHISFLVTGAMFWWPVFHPIPERRMKPGPAIFYLFAAAAENTLLGIILTFMPAGYYPAYIHPEDEIGALHLIREGWGLSAAADQRLGGLLMWVPGCSVYFIAILGILAHWYAQPEADEIEPLYLTGSKSAGAS